MMQWKTCGAGLVLLVGLTPRSWAQIPAAPAAPAVPPLAAPPAAPAPAAPNNLWSFLLPTKDQKTQCKEHICSTPIGQLMNNGLAPIGAFTGGLLGPCCPPFKQDELKMPADSAEGAAARIKADEAGAKARVAAVKYLARVDCHYWPEAADALVNALRGDRNECVRLAAAQALGTGCCCGKKTIVALSIAAAGSDRDGLPSEKSERVRAAAQASLEHCLARCACNFPVAPAPAIQEQKKGIESTPTGDAGKPASTGAIEPAAYYKKVEAMASAQVIEAVRQSTMTWSVPSGTSMVASNSPAPVVGSAAVEAEDSNHSLFGIVGNAFGPVKDLFLPSARLAPQRIEPANEVARVPAPQPTAVPVTNEIQPVVYQTAPASPYASTAASLQHRVIPPSNPAPAPPVYAPSPFSTPSRATTPVIAQPMPEETEPSTTSGPQAGYSPVPRRDLPQLTGSAVPFPPANGVDVGHLTTMLRDGTYPEQREWAAAELASVDWRANAKVLDCLSEAAEKDPSAPVRVQCIRSLGKMKARTVTVLTLLDTLLKDRDARVQQEARQALGKMDSE